MRESSIHGKGVFAVADIAANTRLGTYPGVPRSPAEMVAKAATAPGAKDYCFVTGARVRHECRPRLANQAGGMPLSRSSRRDTAAQWFRSVPKFPATASVVPPCQTSSHIPLDIATHHALGTYRSTTACNPYTRLQLAM